MATGNAPRNPHSASSAQESNTSSAVRRRGLIAGVAAVVAGALAQRTAGPVAAGGTQGTALICGDSTNTATQQTALVPTNNPTIGLLVDNSNNGQNPIGRGVRGISGVGVEGLGGSVGIAGQGLSDGSTGVSGTVQQGVTSGTGVSGTADLYGVAGTASGAFSAGVIGTSTGSSGSGVSGTGRFGVAGGGTSVGVLGTTNAANAVGVSGTGSGANSAGVIGSSDAGRGVAGASTTGIGVYASSDSSFGITGTSNKGTGIYGQTSASNQYGVLGTTYAPNSTAIAGTCTANGSSAFSGGTTNPNAYAGVFQGTVVVQGNFAVTGTKSAVVQHPHTGDYRLLYCLESPESWFEDFGEGTLSGGKREVKLDPDFAALVHTDAYYVFLTPHDAGSKGLAVTTRRADGFVVQEMQGGATSGTFAWRVVAKRADVKSARLGAFVMPTLKLPESISLPKPLVSPEPPKK